MNSLDVRIAGKVTLVEGKNSLDAVDAHCRRQSRIVDLHSRNVLTHQQGTPFLVDCHAVRQKLQLILKGSGPAVGFLRGKREPILIEGSSAGVPEFCNILRCVAKHTAVRKNGVNCRDDQRIVTIIRLYPAKQNITVD